MKTFILFVTTINVICLFMHEFDAFYVEEWKMLGFLKSLKSRTQYLVFLYFHVFFCGFFFYYLWSVFHFINFPLWIGINVLGVLHLIIHLIARKWETNVFKSFSSFLFIGGAAVTGMINLIFYSYYL
ncbi:hypothetical protein SAMN05660297_02860 [Natronincola peptidivorans]|uniref:HXXEE domain-containing protein n=1 Tax=Natronincola peptidivorans TaxID=426128 RepID=A0A1I0FM90_9FIRM|nr:hypothetical protein SAMN05660297_02860 [Natronincola peptidivorans]